MHVHWWIQQVTTRVGAVTCWIQQSVSPKQVVGFTCVFNSEVDQLKSKTLNGRLPFEDSSDFDDSVCVLIVMTRSIIWDTFFSIFLRGGAGVEGRGRGAAAFRKSNVQKPKIKTKTETKAGEPGALCALVASPVSFPFSFQLTLFESRKKDLESPTTEFPTRR